MTSAPVRRRLTLSVSILALAATLPTVTPAAVFVWNGGTDLYGNPLAWSPGGVPGAADDAQVMAAGSVVEVFSTSQSIGTFELGGGNALNINNGNVSIDLGSVTNDGTISIAANSRFDSGSGPLTIGGTGTIVLDNSGGFAHLFENGGIMTLGSGQTVRGSGQVGINSPAIINDGLISADVSGRTLDIDPAGGSGGLGGGGVGTGMNAGFLNNATMQASGGGTLAIDGGLFENGASGVIQALNGSVVSLNGNSRIVGGTLKSIGTGVINAVNTTQYLQAVTLGAGTKVNVTNDNLLLNTSLVNNGTITVAANSRLDSEGGANLTISGTGTIVLDNSAGYAHLFENGGIMTLGSNQVITGSGQIGINNPIIVNNGLLSLKGGGAIDLDVAGGSGGIGGGVGASGFAAFLNNGGVVVAGASTLSIEGGYYDNSPSSIAASGGSTINLNGDSRIVGGTLSADATSAINAVNTTQYLQAVTLGAGTKINVTSDNLLLNTSLVNNGTITVAANSRLDSEGGANLTISGTGTIVLDNSAGYAHLFENGGIMTLGSNQVITGSGQIGINNPLIVNNGLLSLKGGGAIDLDVAGGSGGVGGGLGASGVAAFLNNGGVVVAGASTLSIEGGYYDNSPSSIAASGGSTINLNGDSRIVGGTLSTDAASVINAVNTTQYLQAVTLGAGTNINVRSDNLLLNTSLVNNGTITVAANSRLDSESANLTITGTGTIVLDNSAGYARLFENGGIMTLGSNQVVTGSGQIGLNNPLIVNNGLLSLNGGGAIDLDVAGGSGGVGGGLGASGVAAFLNNGGVVVAGASTLFIEGGYYDNSPSSIAATGGSTINLNADSRIVGGTLSADATSGINAVNTTQYLQAVTLGAGTKINVTSDNLLLNTSLVNNGTITVAANSRLDSEGAANLIISGTGAIVLDNSAGYARLFENGGLMTLGAGQTVSGSGQIGLNNPLIVNNGLINATIPGGGIDIDAAGGSGGIGGGVGSGTSSLYNTGLMSASNSTLAFEGGLYENGASDGLKQGGLLANDGGLVVFNGDASLFNLQAGGVLNKGYYGALDGGAGATVDLRSNAANSIVTIGTAGGAADDTFVELSGANSTIAVIPFGGGAPTTIDATLTGVAASGELEIENTRVLTITANSGAFSNAGFVFLNNGTLGASGGSAGVTNSGILLGYGAVTTGIANTGRVEALGGTLATQAIAGPTGVIQTDTGATLTLSAATAGSTAGTLTNNGSLVLGSHNVTVTSDYANANFGSGNAFNRRANVSGAGDIFGVNYTVDLSGPALSGGVINVGNVRTGGSSSTTLTITNNGTATNIVGAVQNTNAPSIALSSQDFALAHGGGSTTVTLSYTGTTAGSLNGQTIEVLNNFANVGPQTLGVAGSVYQIAVAGAQPAAVTLAASRVGGAVSSTTLNIANVAPITPGFNEALTSTASTASPFQVNGASSATVSNLAAGSSVPVTLSLGNGTAGAFSNTVAISNTSIPVAGSGFTPLALAGQTVNVSGNVYAPAVASLSSTSVDFGPVRQGAASPMQSLSLTNTSVGALSDVLVSSVGSVPAGVTAGTPGPLAQGATGAVVFALSTATPGQLAAAGSLNFASHDAELADMTLAPQTVNFTGTVTQLAQALVTKNSGVGTLTGGGTTYNLDLGSFASGVGRGNRQRSA